MRARHVIGIIFLVLAVLCLGPMVMMPGFSVVGSPAEASLFAVAIFAVPALLLILTGALVVGAPHRWHATGWTLVAGAAYGAATLMMVVPMMNSPDWDQLMQATAQQRNLEMPEMAISLGRPLLLAALLLVCGGAMLAWHHRHRLARPSEAVPDGSRPVSVTVIAVILLVSAGMGVLSLLISGVTTLDQGFAAVEAAWGIPAELQKALSVVGFAVFIVCGIFLLRGANWSRWLLLVFTLANVVYQGTWLNSPGWMLPSLLWIAAYVYFLFLRDPARRYFARRSVAV